MTQSTTTPINPTPEPPDPATAVDAEEPDLLPPLENLGADLDSLNRRIQTLLRAAAKGSRQVTADEVLRFFAEELMIQMDHLTHTKRMEEHAVWASEQLEELTTAALGNEAASQLHQTDAARYTEFFTRLRIFLDTLAEEPALSVLTKDNLRLIQKEASELLTLTEEITLEPTAEGEEEAEGDDDEDDDEDETAEAE